VSAACGILTGSQDTAAAVVGETPEFFVASLVHSRQGTVIRR
jgi:hypothetical protein